MLSKGKEKEGQDYPAPHVWTWAGANFLSLRFVIGKNKRNSYADFVGLSRELNEIM